MYVVYVRTEDGQKTELGYNELENAAMWCNEYANCSNVIMAYVYNNETGEIIYLAK